MISSVCLELRLPRDKLQHIKKEMAALVRKQKVSARVLVRMLGKLTAAILAVHSAPLHYRNLQRLKHQALHGAGYDGEIKMTQEAKEDMLWCSKNLAVWNGKVILRSSPEITIETDASDIRWGAFSQGERQVVDGAQRRELTTSIGWNFKLCILP